jgi:protein-tyrosine-phosphatase
MKYVLFVCTDNADRSLIAQELFERCGPEVLEQGAR